MDNAAVFCPACGERVADGTGDPQPVNAYPQQANVPQYNNAQQNYYQQPYAPYPQDNSYQNNYQNGYQNGYTGYAPPQQPMYGYPQQPVKVHYKEQVAPQFGLPVLIATAIIGLLILLSFYLMKATGWSYNGVGEYYTYFSFIDKVADDIESPSAVLIIGFFLVLLMTPAVITLSVIAFVKMGVGKYHTAWVLLKVNWILLTITKTFQMLPTLFFRNEFSSMWMDRSSFVKTPVLLILSFFFTIGMLVFSCMASGRTKQKPMY